MPTPVTVSPEAEQQEVHTPPLKDPGQQELNLMLQLPGLTPRLQGTSKIRENVSRRWHEDTISKILEMT